MKAENRCGRCHDYALATVTYTHPTSGARLVERACDQHVVVLGEAADRLGISDMEVHWVAERLLPLAARKAAS